MAAVDSDLPAALFVGLVAALVALLLLGARAVARRAGYPAAAQRRLLLTMALALGGWLAVCATLAASGWLAHWAALPPRLLVVLLPPMLVTVWLTRSAEVGRLLDQVPAAALVAPQVFRVLMEVILWLLFVNGQLPVQMTFEGQNFDILVGLTAPLVAWRSLKRRAPWRPAFLTAWHWLSLALLANIVVVAILATPVFGAFAAPFNIVIAHWPFVWLPGLVVPVAYALHVLGLRQLARQRRVAGRAAAYGT